MAVRGDDNKMTFSEEATASEESISKTAARPEQKVPSSTRLRLGNLPNELLGHIIDYLDSECPSERNWNQRPDTTLTQSTTLDLKIVSCISKHLRHLVLPRLFFDFIHRYNLTNQITSLVANLSGSCTHLHPAWWSRILTTIPLTTFTILCPPYVFAELTHTSLIDTDSWVFNMPYHTVSAHDPADPFRSSQ